MSDAIRAGDSAATALATARRVRRARLGAALVPYLYILPAVLVVGVVIVYPLVIIFQESTQTLSSGASQYVGLGNYDLVRTDAALDRSLLKFLARRLGRRAAMPVEALG